MVFVSALLDGGPLLRWVSWVKGENFADICRRYIEHVSNRYPGAVIVFDGYSDNPSTKDFSLMRRRKGITATEAI